ncbi:MAG: hypothetical protein HY658_11550 [Actinobacteria bacterium]|nr:hypothetical protein [Actinomycetota bacterium]
MRRFIVALATLAFVAGGAGAAQAHVTDVGTDFGLHKFVPEFSRVQMFGFIDCTPGESFSLRVTIWGEAGVATGRASGPCEDGEVTTENGGAEWVARLRVTEGSFGEFDEVFWRIRAVTSDGNVKVKTGFALVIRIGLI